jgi:hypothetical protein
MLQHHTINHNILFTPHRLIINTGRCGVYNSSAPENPGPLSCSYRGMRELGKGLLPTTTTPYPNDFRSLHSHARLPFGPHRSVTSRPGVACTTCHAVPQRGLASARFLGLSCGAGNEESWVLNDTIRFVVGWASTVHCSTRAATPARRPLYQGFIVGYRNLDVAFTGRWLTGRHVYSISRYDVVHRM